MNRLKRTPQLMYWLASAICIVPCSGIAEPQSLASDAGSRDSAPLGFSAALPGDMHDFDFLAGAWKTQQHRLKARGVGSSTWEDSPPNQHCARAYLDGRAVIDESRFPNGNAAGLFLYSFDQQKHQWSIYWIDPKTGQPDSGTFGGFDGAHGEFYSDDVDDGRPVKVRVTWVKLDRDHARWEQAFSFDQRTWETNWIADFTRADPAAVCSKL